MRQKRCWTSGVSGSYGSVCFVSCLVCACVCLEKGLVLLLDVSDSVLHVHFGVSRFSGILGSFQNNWVSPEQQMAQTFLACQNMLTMDISTQELREFFEYQVSKFGEQMKGLWSNHM